MFKSFAIFIVAGALLFVGGCKKDEAAGGDAGSVAGAGGGEAKKDSEPSNPVKDSVVGKYKLILDTAEVPESEKAMMADMAKDTPDIAMDFRADGTADLLAKGDNMTAKWEVVGDTLTVTPDKPGEDKGVFKVTDGGKTLEPDASMNLEPIGKAVYRFKKQ